MPADTSATSLVVYAVNVGSASSITWVCSLMITEAMSSVMPKNSNPRSVKNCSDRLRSLTGRLTNSFVAIAVRPFLVAAIGFLHARQPASAAPARSCAATPVT